MISVQMIVACARYLVHDLCKGSHIPVASIEAVMTLNHVAIVNIHAPRYGFIEQWDLSNRSSVPTVGHVHCARHSHWRLPFCCFDAIGRCMTCYAAARRNLSILSSNINFTFSGGCIPGTRPYLFVFLADTSVWQSLVLINAASTHGVLALGTTCGIMAIQNDMPLLVP